MVSAHKITVNCPTYWTQLIHSILSSAEPGAVAICVEMRHLLNRYASRRPVPPARPAQGHDAAWRDRTRKTENFSGPSHSPQRQRDQRSAQTHGARGQQQIL